MRFLIRFTLFVILLGILSPAAAQLSCGEAVKIDDDWKFHPGDPENAASPRLADSTWRALDLPHDWSVEGPYSPSLASATGYLPGGIAWYRKTLAIPAQRINQKVFLYFEGIYRNGAVFINGMPAGMRPNGYISQYYDITPMLQFGRDNLIAVRVDHSESADSRWYTGSGIYRNVWLVYANPVHLSPWGVFYTTPAVDAGQAQVAVQTSVDNSTASAATVTVLQELFDRDHKRIAHNEKKLAVPARATATLHQAMTLSRPQLWSLDAPYLYTLRTSVRHGAQPCDQTETPVGIRSLSFDANTGFALNGRPLKVKGVCLHHDAGCLGAAVPQEVWERRLRTLKSLGCNAIRTSHNPQAPVFYDLCDRLGLLVMNEAFDEWEFPKKKWLAGWNVGTPGFQGPAAFFAEWGERDLRDMVLRDRNHPAVFMWSIGNEVDYPNDPYSHPILDQEGIHQQHTHGYLPDHPHAERLGAIAQRLAAVVRKYDSSRPVTAGLAGPVMSNQTAYPAALDVAGYNYTESRYAMDHAAYPKRILFGSETGHSLEAWQAVRDNPYIFGQFLWTGIDYLGESHPWPSRGFPSGLLDLAGFRKPRAWFRESLWSDKPMVYIGTFPAPGDAASLHFDALPLWNYAEGDSVRIAAYTNCQEVQLLLDGEKIGPAKRYDAAAGVIYWEFPFRPGRLEAVGYSAGAEAARFVIATSKAPHAIQARQVNGFSGPRSVAQVELQIVDADGRPVLLADNEITCTTAGPVGLLGMETGDETDMGEYHDRRQRVYQGRMIVYLEAMAGEGDATVTFSAPWLEEARLVLERTQPLPHP